MNGTKDIPKLQISMTEIWLAGITSVLAAFYGNTPAYFGVIFLNGLYIIFLRYALWQSYREVKSICKSIVMLLFIGLSLFGPLLLSKILSQDRSPYTLITRAILIVQAVWAICVWLGTLNPIIKISVRIQFWANTHTEWATVVQIVVFSIILIIASSLLLLPLAMEVFPPNA